MNHSPYLKANKEKLFKENELLIAKFINDLTGSSARVIKHAKTNVDLFLNDYLAYFYVENYLSGIERIIDYFGDYGINKLMFTSESALRLATSDIKKFYKFLYKTNRISKLQLEDVCYSIKICLPDWIEQLEESY